jgi:hypothetical protein
MRIKPGVSLANLQPQMALAALVVDSVFRRGGYDAMITSGSDGTHNGQPVIGDTRDPHYMGKALDFRVSDIKPEDLPHIVNGLQVCLSSEFVLLQEADHLHLQYGRIA